MIGYGIFVYLNKEKFSKCNHLNNSEKILNLLEEKRKITNNDIEELLNIADSTATKYLQKLEDEGKIKQIGETGRSVYYKKK